MGWLNLGKLIAELLDRREDPDDYDVYVPDTDLDDDDGDNDQ